ncbi:alpha/beta fold hydrolase [Promicromonospora vindobonensis]|uniref:Alpha/beta fold hydrolase n=1 Tax=Promicromonospora vindobonensis TaxID=195748 RepID=A0ABW5VWK9_9MICO
MGPPGDPRHIVVNGVRLAYDDLGDGPAILFVHGFLLDRTMWRHQVRTLDGLRRIAPDLRGMGRSEAPEQPYDVSVYADDLAGLLDALGVERTVVCGLSLGGYVAFELLRRHRERVAALVVLDARAEADTAERRARRTEMIARVRHGDVGGLLDELAPTFLAHDAPADVRRQLRAMMRCPAPAGIVGALEAMRDRPDALPVLRSSAPPTLLLIGEHDARTPRASMQEIADQVPGSTVDSVPGSGHLPPLENPAATTDRISAFLDGLGSVVR